MTLSRGRSCSSGFEWDSSFVRCLILLTWMTSCTVGIPRSLRIVSLVTYYGTSTIARNILDWSLSMTAMLDLQVQPHNSMPYVHIGVMIDVFFLENNNPYRVSYNNRDKINPSLFYGSLFWCCLWLSNLFFQL